MSTHARHERALLADLLEQAGPDEPTLCEGWTTRDLAAHLVVREGRVDAAGGLVLKPLAARLARVQHEYTMRPYEELVRAFRAGPPKGSLFRIPGADEAANTVEYFVHVEDVRRAKGGWEPRVLDAGFSEALWSRLARTARMMARQAPVGLVFRLPDGRTVVAHKGAPVATVTGEPGELMLFASGRQAKANVVVEGDADVVARIRDAKLGI
jgi:uncharacterized protein (TIGR03085 family)